VDDEAGRIFSSPGAAEPDACHLCARPASTINDESIGFLTYPTDIPGWEREFRTRYAFLADLDDADRRWARCDPRDRYRFEALGPDQPA
jgi:hypothetical protein